MSYLVTISPANLELTPEQLFSTPLATYMDRFRAILRRSGAYEHPGWAAFRFHGEENENTGRIFGHHHGVISADFKPVIDRMRRLPNFRNTGGFARIRVETLHLPQGAQGLSYAFPSSAYRRWRNPDPQGIPRKSHRRRMSAMTHARWLLWMHQASFSDVGLLIGLTVTRQGLRVTR